MVSTTVGDAALRALLTEVAAQAAACMRTERGLLVVHTIPEDALLRVGGEVVGLAGREVELPPGRHLVTLEMDGHISMQIGVNVITNETSEVGPVALREGSPSSATAVASGGGSSGPHDGLGLGIESDLEPFGSQLSWYEWTLWSVGAVGTAVGFGYLVYAGNRDDDLRDLRNDGAVIDDPAHEQGVIDRVRRAGGVTLGLGLVALGTATYFYLREDLDDEGTSPIRADVSVDPGRVRVDFGWQF